MDMAEIEKFNPWWKTGKMRDEWAKPFKRKLYYEASKYTARRQAVLIQGLRRMGKTTIMFQIINDLLSQTSPKNILYFSFDEIVFDMRAVLDEYQKMVLGKLFDGLEETVFIFLDEIQKVGDWENKIKVYYDLYPKLKFFLSGSASVKLRKKSKESLAGRVFDFTLEPLSFEEFLEIRGIETGKIRADPALWEREILPLFYKYIKWGTFPELVTEENEETARRYIANVIERVIYKDLQDEFRVKDIELLKSILLLVGKRPGMLVNYKEIAKNLGRDQRTVSNYFEYLEFSLLVRFVFNYRGSPLASARKMKKAYFTTPNIIFALNPNEKGVLPFMLENTVLMKTGARFFYKNSYEVDFLLEERNGLTAIEVKSEGAKVKQLKSFSRKFGRKMRKCFIVDFEKEGREGGIPIVPAWKLLLIQNV